MAVVRKDGKTKIMYFPKVASQAYTNNEFVILTSGSVQPATSSSTTILGVLRRAVVAADADYALTSLVPVEVPVEKYVEWEVLTTGSTYGVGIGVDLSDSVTVNLAGNTHHVVTVTKIISSTVAWVVINALYDSVVGA